MFASTKLKLVLGLYVLIILAIPGGAYLLSKRQSTSEPVPIVKTAPSPTSIPSIPSSPSVTPSPKDSEAPLAFGPVLNFTLVLEGRPASNQTSKIFIGIADGDPTANPKYVLSFTIDLPASGEFSGLSLAGLNVAGKYTAYIKGPAQIATASAFTMLPSATTLNSGEPLTLLSGDLNEDNVINTADFSIAKATLGANENSSKWNANIDLNKDGVINSLDLSYIIKNFGKTGLSGVWVSTPGSTSSGSLQSTPSGYPGGTPGYWLWVPGF